jgi:hypothetical protein
MSLKFATSSNAIYSVGVLGCAVFVSPYERTRETYFELRSQLRENRVLKAREVSIQLEACHLLGDP